MEKERSGMQYIVFGVVLLSVMIQFIHRVLGWYETPMGASVAVNPKPQGWVLDILLVIPIALFVVAVLLQRYAPKQVPLCNVLTLTFSSISMISGSGGSVVFHFSIFMVVAIAAFYDDVRLLSVMTVIFAVQHLFGFFVDPRLVFGVSSYPLSMLLVHAIFLILTSGATSYLILTKRHMARLLEAKAEASRLEAEAVKQKVIDTSAILTRAAEQLSNNSSETTRAAEQISLALQQIAIGAETQADYVSDITSTLQQTDASVVHIRDGMEEVAQLTNQTERDAISGTDAIHNVTEQMNRIQLHVSRLADEIQALAQYSEQIDSIADVITSIAQQTNILSLNAKIEAARSDENGRGFHVVATEVRKLALQSTESGQHISELIAAVKSKIDVIAAASKQSNQEVLSGIEQMANASRRFYDISTAIRTVSGRTEGMSRALQQLATGSNSVVQNISQIQHVIVQTARGTQDISAASEEQMASLQEVSASASELTSIAGDMYGMVRTLQ